MIKHSGIVRRVDDLRRINLTKALCEQYGIGYNTPCELIPTDDGILIRNYTLSVSELIETAKQEYINDDSLSVRDKEDEILSAFDTLIEMLHKVGE